MQRNLNGRLTLTLSLMLLSTSLAACAKQPSESASTAPAPQAGDTGDNEPSVAVDSKRSVRAGMPSQNRDLAKAGKTKPQPQAKDQGDTLDIPPPPLGLVPVAANRTETKTVALANIEDHLDQDDHLNGESKSKVSLANQTTSTRERGQPSRFSAAKPRDSVAQTSNQFNPSQPSGKKTSASVSKTRSQTGNSGTIGRKREPTEQELRAQKMIHERAAELGRQRQLRLAVRRHGNTNRFTQRGAGQIVRSAGDPGTTVPTALRAETAQNR